MSRLQIATGVKIAGLALPALLAGCATSEKCALDRCPDIPPGAMPSVSGSQLHRIQDAQSIKAEADDFVFYKHEWFMGGAELGPYGKYHLQQVAQRLPAVPFPVLIQASADPKLNDARRIEIIKALGLAGVGDAEQRVVIGFPEAEGLYGDEAERIYGQMIQGAGGGGNGFGAGVGNSGLGGYGSGNFFGGARNAFRGGLGVGNLPFYR